MVKNLLYCDKLLDSVSFPGHPLADSVSSPDLLTSSLDSNTRVSDH